MEEKERVAIIALNFRLFNFWLRKNGKHEEEYIYISSEEEARDRLFDRVEYSDGWERLKDAEHIEKIVKRRLTNLTPP